MSLSHETLAPFVDAGLDLAHFSRALQADLPVAPEIAALTGSVLGYLGAIDERLDYELIARIADARPDWHVLMVGPTLKVDPTNLPQRPNLHWLGSRPCAALPALVKGFDVALLPFALNAATTRFNPPSARAYMTAGRPVVSTALDQVKLNFKRAARIARSHSEFIALCAAEIVNPSRLRIRRGFKLATAQAWDDNVEQIEVLAS
jgi:hypothetical protein